MFAHAYNLLLFCTLFPGIGSITSVVVTVDEQCLNLAEVWLFSQGNQVNPTSLNFNMSSTGSWCTTEGLVGGSRPCSAGFCNDGLFSTICHSGCTGVNNLVVRLSEPTQVDEIVIQNRQDALQQRLGGATVAGYLYNAVLWSTAIPPTSALSYTIEID